MIIILNERFPCIMYASFPQSLSNISNTHLKRRYSWLYMRTSRENKEYLENVAEITEYRKYVYPVYVNLNTPSNVKFKLYLKKASQLIKYTKFKIVVLCFMWVSASKTARKSNDLNYIPFNLVVSHGMWVHDRLYLKTREFKFWIATIQINKLRTMWL